MTPEEIDEMESGHSIQSDGPRHDQDVKLLISEVWRLHDQQAVLIAYLESTATMVGWLALGAQPRQANAQEFSDELHPGDLVVEETTSGDPFHDQRRLGWLVRQGIEPLHTDAEWEEAVKTGDYLADEKRPEAQITYLRTPAGETVRWHNAVFARLPQNQHEQAWALQGKLAFKAAQRCADCGTCAYAPPEKDWTQFDPETGACRNCHGLVNRPTQEEIDAWDREIAGRWGNTQSV